jgi:hypothetical protein
MLASATLQCAVEHVSRSYCSQSEQSTSEVTRSRPASPPDQPSAVMPITMEIPAVVMQQFRKVSCINNLTFREITTVRAQCMCKLCAQKSRLKVCSSYVHLVRAHDGASCVHLVRAQVMCKLCAPIHCKSSLSMHSHLLITLNRTKRPSSATYSHSVSLCWPPSPSVLVELISK